LNAIYMPYIYIYIYIYIYNIYICIHIHERIYVIMGCGAGGERGAEPECTERLWCVAERGQAGYSVAKERNRLAPRNQRHVECVSNGVQGTGTKVLSQKALMRDFTCFTSTKVQILTHLRPLKGAASSCRADAWRAARAKVLSLLALVVQKYKY
jgi:hypothetical protein